MPLFYVNFCSCVPTFLSLIFQQAQTEASVQQDTEEKKSIFYKYIKEEEKKTTHQRMVAQDERGKEKGVW